MTVAAGLETIVATGVKTAALNMPKAGTAGLGNLRADTSAVNIATSASNFRSGFQEVLSSLEEPSSMPVAEQTDKTPVTTESNVKRTIQGQSRMDTIQVATSTPEESQTLSWNKQTSLASTTYLAAKTAQVPATSSEIATTETKKGAQSTVTHSSRHAFSPSESSTTNADVSHLHPSTSIVVPVYSITEHIAQASPVEKSAPMQKYAVLSYTAGQAVQDKTVGVTAFPEHNAIPAPTNHSSVSGISSAVSEVQADTAEDVHSALNAASISASHGSAGTDPEPNLARNSEQKADKTFQFNGTSLSQATSDEPSSAKSSNNAAPIPSGVEEAAHLPHADGAPKLRDKAPIQHDIAVTTAAVQSSTAFTTSIPSGVTPVRDAGGVPYISNNNGLSAAHTVSEARDTFAALDSAAGQPETTWLHASARHAEAGYLDPSLGWVSVRADASTNGLHASVVPSSPEAAQTLSTHLADLNSYLAEHHGSAITASLASPEQSGNNNHTAGSAGQNPGQGNARDGAQQQRNNSTQDSAVTPSAAWTSSAQGTEFTTITHTRSGGISVIA